MPGARCLPRRMDPPASRHPGCRRETWPRCVSTRGHPPSRRCPRTACSQSLARQQRRRAVRRVVGVGDVSAPAANLSDYVVATRASCLSRSTSRFEAKRCCGATLRAAERRESACLPGPPRSPSRSGVCSRFSRRGRFSLSRFQRTSLLSSPRLTQQKRGKSRSSVTGARRRKLGTRRCLRSSRRLSPPVRTWARAGRAASSSSGASERGC